MSPPDARTPEQREIDADRRAEWWLVLQALVALAAVVALVVLGGMYGLSR